MRSARRRARAPPVIRSLTQYTLRRVAVHVFPAAEAMVALPPPNP